MSLSRSARWIVIPLLMLLVLFAAAAEAETARDLTAECTYSFSKGSNRNTNVLYDHDYKKIWKSDKSKNNFLEVHLPEGETCSGVQIKWASIQNRRWCVEVRQGGEWVAVDAFNEETPYLTTWTPLEGVTEFRIASHNTYPHTLEINELVVLSAGDLPDSIQVWEPTWEKADMMVIIAHPDDEYVFFGAIIPYYGAERGKRVIAAYITESSTYRRTELLDGLWTCGQRHYPLVGKFYDRYTMSAEEAYKKMGKNKVRSYVIEIFRRYKPDVVVTHDIHGEYGHGVHKVCADAVINALQKSGNAKNDRDSAKAYGTWDVPKCYIHLYEKDRVVFDWNAMKLSAFGGRSAFEVADEAWRCHLSQQASKYMVYMDDSPYDSQVFGLYRTLVGPDRAHDDFFENLPESPAD